MALVSPDNGLGPGTTRMLRALSWQQYAVPDEAMCATAPRLEIAGRWALWG